MGVLIALGQLPKLLGLSKGIPLLQGFASPELWKWEGLAVGVVTIVLMEMAPRITRKAPAAIIGLFGGIIAYFALALVSPGLLILHGNPLGRRRGEGPHRPLRPLPRPFQFAVPL
ncbi:MAG: hypothetical protein Q7I93_06810 [Syntrophales bacterium]|nr:hypothetical protein [Syntrophales bacterium]